MIPLAYEMSLECPQIEVCLKLCSKVPFSVHSYVIKEEPKLVIKRHELPREKRDN